MRKHQAKPERAKNHKVEFEERRDRETSKISCGVSGEKKPHTNAAHPSSQKIQSLPLVNAISPSAFLRQQPQQVTAQELPEPLCSLVFTISTRSAEHRHFHISTDYRTALDCKNPRVATGSSCKACFCDLSLASVYMGRMECHRAYPLRYT